MRIVFAFILLCGLGLAGTAAFMVMKQFNQYATDLEEAKRLQAPAIELVEIVVAGERLDYGAVLEEENLEVVSWPADAIPDGAFLSLEDLMGGEDAEPRAILRVMETDEAILSSKITEFGGNIGPQGLLSPGMRAFTIQVGVTSGIFIQPNDRIDIYWTGNNGREVITRQLLENIRVVAVDRNSNEDAQTRSVAKTVTVEVNPTLVATLTQAQQTGKINLSLRGIGDDAFLGGVEVTTQDVTLVQEEAIVEEIVDQKCYTTVTKSGVRERVEIPCSE